MSRQNATCPCTRSPPNSRDWHAAQQRYSEATAAAVIVMYQRPLSPSVLRDYKCTQLRYCTTAVVIKPARVVCSNRRRLSAAKAAEEAGGEEPAARLWGNHLLMVLDEAGHSTALQQELRQELAKVPTNVASHM